MLTGYFTEQCYKTYPASIAQSRQPDDHPARNAGDSILLFSNRFFNREDGARLYRERLEEHRLAEEVGFDAIMINEHHTGAYCMNARCNIMTAAIAAATERVLLFQAGNPLPLWDNPVQLAEELAMIDLMSNGRLIAGIVRGGGTEQLANNINPVHNRARFQEAHDLLVKTWTVPGPWSWEGEHYQVRVVNPWVLPLQTPHPKIVVPGVSSEESIIWAAQHAYPYVALNTTIEATKKIWSLYDQAALETGYVAGPEHRAYLVRCHVQATREKALENAEKFNWLRGAETTGTGSPVWLAPTGYSSFDARKARIKMFQGFGKSMQDQLDSLTLIAGTPEEALAGIRIWMEETRPGTLIFMPNEGPQSHEDASECIRLLGNEVLPAVREMAAELDLPGPFEKAAGISPEVVQAMAS